MLTVSSGHDSVRWGTCLQNPKNVTLFCTRLRFANIFKRKSLTLVGNVTLLSLSFSPGLPRRTLGRRDPRSSIVRAVSAFILSKCPSLSVGDPEPVSGDLVWRGGWLVNGSESMPSAMFKGVHGGIEGTDPDPTSFNSNRSSCALDKISPKGTSVPLGSNLGLTLLMGCLLISCLLMSCLLMSCLWLETYGTA